MKKNKIYLAITLLSFFYSLQSCKKYLDIIPDNIADVEMIFDLRVTAERYLFTLYASLPSNGQLSTYNQNIGALAGNEFVYSANLMNTIGPFAIARGLQNSTNPYADYWNSASKKSPFQSIRDCNIFIENLHRVPDMPNQEKLKWIAEAKFLKAYYHFLLFKMYGPIPIIDKNISLSASSEEIFVYRRPVDEVVKFMVNLLDESAKDLDPVILSRVDQLGRVTKSTALMLKAYILITAASPLYNGNADFQDIKNNTGESLFTTTYDPQKWEDAAKAAKEAIQVFENAGGKLYYFSAESASNVVISPYITVELSIRNALTEKWNSETIWANSNSIANSTQTGEYMPRLNSEYSSNFTDGSLNASLNLALDFYTENGVPLEEDRAWDYEHRFDLQKNNNYPHIIENYTTAKLNYYREPRYYATLGFDGSYWYGCDKYDENDQWKVYAKKGQTGYSNDPNYYSTTGYFPKKLVHYETTTLQAGVQVREYPWPEFRLSNLYLLFAEASNEAYGPSDEVYYYLDLIRKRAGLNTILDSWQQHAKNPNKPKTKEGLREIIQQERKIELALEGHRFWDQKRWKTASKELNTAILGWDTKQSTEQAYYRVVPVLQRNFGTKDYFWPIPQTAIIQNKNLTQNLGW